MINFCIGTFLNLNGIYLFAEQIDKCREKVWKKGVEFEEGERTFPQKVFSPSSSTDPYWEQNIKFCKFFCQPIHCWLAKRRFWCYYKLCELMICYVGLFWITYCTIKIFKPQFAAESGVIYAY